jgi:NADPH:quinone reductase-like Zn-dependent oxidoreductase
VPERLSFDEAGVLAVDGLTALAGLAVLGLGPGQSLMIFGASGGVGHVALEFAKRIGARVLAIASGRDGVALARKLGADEAIDGHEEGSAALAGAFSPNGVDAALVLAPGADELLKLVKQGGRVAHPNGVVPPPRPHPGVVVRAFDGYHGRAALDRLNELVAKKSFHVEVSKKYPLEQTPKALADVTRHHLGKLAIRVNSGPH